MNLVLKKDYYRLTGKEYKLCRFIFSYITEHRIRFIYTYRKLQCISNKRIIAKLLLLFYHRSLKVLYGLEINPSVEIGPGIHMSHPYNITINNGAKLGSNVNIHKGVTIGQENRGKRAGTPTIGNMVYIGINSTIVGNVTIGDDVLIAPNTFVNCNVPSHSVVLGNPCKIIPKENATEGYVNFLV